MKAGREGDGITITTLTRTPEQAAHRLIPFYHSHALLDPATIRRVFVSRLVAQGETMKPKKGLFKERRDKADAEWRKKQRERARYLREFIEWTGAYPSERGVRWLGQGEENRKTTKHQITRFLEGMEARDLAIVFFVAMTFFNVSRRQTA